MYDDDNAAGFLYNGIVDFMLRMMLRFVTLIIIYIIMSGGIIPRSVPFIHADNHETLILFAASSLTEAMTDLSAAYEKQSGVAVTLQLAGSSTLAVQIAQGAPADVFASANLMQMETAIASERIAPDDVRIFAANELALITPADNPAEIHSVADLAREGVLIVLAGEGVPVRVYSDALLNTLADRYGASYPQEVYANLVSEAANVRQVVARVALGEADAALVYRTDITPDIADDVRIVPLPAGSSPQALYPIAPLVDSPHADRAADFIAFVQSAEGQAILREWSFCPPPPLDAMPEHTPEATTDPTSSSIPETTPTYAHPAAESTPTLIPDAPACD